VEVEVFSEEILTGARRLTSRAYLTFVAIDRSGGRVRVPPLLLETDEQRETAREAEARRALRLAARKHAG
jgi:acyl-CoA hydrolase